MTHAEKLNVLEDRSPEDPLWQLCLSAMIPSRTREGLISSFKLRERVYEDCARSLINRLNNS